MRKHDLTDVTFLFPIRLDSIVRIENLIASIGFLSRNFSTHIMVLHADRYDNGIIRKVLPKSVEYLFVEDYDDVFYRTKYINMMVRKVDTPIVGVWDADVIIPVSQVLESILFLRTGGDICYPYDGKFYDTSTIIRSLYIKSKDVRLLTKNVSKMQLIYGDDMKGGAFFANKERYVYSGMENENFYGWGPEDFERYSRWKVLEFKIKRTRGNLFHLTHARGTNSSFRSQQQVLESNKERLKTKCSSKEEILENINKNIL